MFLVLASSLSFARTVTIPSGSTQAQIQRYFNSATSTNNRIAFSAGTYNILTSLKLPCIRGGVTITGPAISPTYTSWGTLTYSKQTAILSSSSRSSFLFNVSGCTNPIKINYLQFANAGAIYVGFPSKDLTFAYNSIVNIPCHSGPAAPKQKIRECTLTATIRAGSVLSNLVVEWNQIGDPKSCLTPAMS